MTRASIDIVVLAGWLGHVDTATTAVYIFDVPVGPGESCRPSLAAIVRGAEQPGANWRQARRSSRPPSAREAAITAENSGESELPMRFERTTCGLRNRCSTTELG